MGSHVYNAWLAQIAEQGKASGVYVVWQWNNIFFDLLLFYFAKWIGLVAAEKIAVSLCVLIFFWGVFSFSSVVAHRPPWLLTPLIAMLAYGFVFHMGFMNYYLSLGLASIGVALVWPVKKNGLLAAGILAPFMFFAHPLGLLWFAGAAAYRILWTKLPGWWKLLLPAAAFAVVFGVRWFVARQAQYEVEWRDTPLWRLSGADQFRIFGDRYLAISSVIFVFALSCTAVDWRWHSDGSTFWTSRRLVLELYLISFCTTALLPENLRSNPSAGWIGLLVTRLTLISAIFGVCWLASLAPRWWHLPGFGAIAAMFFVFLWQDTAYLNRMEAGAEKITHELPFGTRVVATIFAPAGYRTAYLHIVDRACAGHCFLVSNYEPSTGQFRVRVRRGSPVVTASVDDSEDMQSGAYDVQEEDLPLKQIYQCEGSDLTRICIRDLAADEKNGQIGYHPVSNPYASHIP